MSRGHYPGCSGRCGAARRVPGVLLEALCVGLAGVGFALLANGISSRGLPLARHLPREASGRTPATTAMAPRAGGHKADGSLEDATAEGVVARLEARGLRLVNSNQVQQLFVDPRRGAELVVFVDARDAPQYEKGHIPAAHLLDPYRPERGLASVLAVCATAEQVVVYCAGIDCEDSELAAGLLLDSGVPSSKVLVYVGGFAEWTANGLPVETGLPENGRTPSGDP